MNPNDHRRPRPQIHFSVLLREHPTECGSCGQPTEPGLIGWYEGKANGPLCLSCLLENAPDLGAVVAVVQLIREVGANLRDGSVDSETAERLLGRFAFHYERFAAPRWPRHPLDFLEILRGAFGYDCPAEDVN